MIRLLISLLLFASCSKQAPEWNQVRANRKKCATCLTTVLSTKVDCPDLYTEHRYEICDSNFVEFARKNTYVWLTPDGTTHRVKTECTVNQENLANRGEM
jgi:hypothetical protein